jgi:hypothetical protein
MAKSSALPIVLLAGGAIALVAMSGQKRCPPDSGGDGGGVSPPVSPRPRPGFVTRAEVGDTILGMTGEAYGVGPGDERLRLAQAVVSHPLNQRFVRPSKSQFNRENFPDGMIALVPEFSCIAEEQYASPTGGSGVGHPFVYFPEI